MLIYIFVMFGWIISVILAIVVVLFGTARTEPMTGSKTTSKTGIFSTSNQSPSTVGLRKSSSVYIPTVHKEDSSFWSSTPGLKSVLKPSGSSSGKKKSIKWADHADYRAITSKGKITDKTVKIN